MKHKNNYKNNYTILKRNLFIRMLAAALITAGLGIWFYSFLRGKTGDAIVNYLQNILPPGGGDAQTYYQYTIRNNLTTILTFFIALLIILVYLAAFRSLFTYIARMFDHVSSNLDDLAEEKEEMDLPGELDFLADKFKYCRAVMKDREREAVMAEKRKNDLVVYLAHDIRPPLTSVIGYLNLLSEAPDMPVLQRAKYTDIALDKAYRLEKLINEFFEITRYNLQTLVLQKESIDLYYMLFQMIEEFYPQLEPAGKKAVLHAEEDLTVYGDPDKLARVFNNILKNAAVYSRNDSIIEMEAKEEDGQVRIAFSNWGVTIPPHRLNTIFDKFFRLDDARSSNSGGSGLGLAIAKEIVELHGGTVSASSNDGLTVFTVLLPLKESEDRQKFTVS